MRVTGIGMTLHGPEGAASPPLPFIEVDDNEGDALIALYPAHVAIVSDGADADADEAERLAESERLAAEWAASEEAARVAGQAEEVERLRLAAEAETERQRVADEEADRQRINDEATTEAARVAAEVEAARLAAEQSGGNGGDGSGEDANTELADAIDLLDPQTDFVKTGARKGRPKLNVIVDILGRDVTAEEVDAAFAAKDPAE